MSRYDPELRADDEPKYSMPDGSYPIDNCADVHSAAVLAHHSKKYSFEQVKEMVLKAKKGLGCPDSSIPDTWKEQNARPLACLVRSTFGPGTLNVVRQEEDGQGTTLTGHFSKFNTWYEVNDAWEGHFLERVASQAFDKTISEDRGSMKVLFDHGMDPAMGNKPLGPIRTLENDGVGAFYEVPLLDVDYNRDFILPALEGKLMDGSKAGSQLGASFQFMVHGDSWDRSNKVSSTNPKGLPRRTITEAQVFEFGPVTFPASGAASAGVRSGTGDFVNRLLTDPAFVARLAERSSPRVVQQMLEAAHSQAGAIEDEEAGGKAQAESGHIQRLRRQAEAFLLGA